MEVIVSHSIVGIHLKETIFFVLLAEPFALSCLVLTHK